MQLNRTRSRQGRRCPILCVTKTVLFVLINVGVLFVPLGDPKELCSPGGYAHEKPVLMYLCKTYDLYLLAADYITIIADILRSLIWEALSNAKSKLCSSMTGNDKDNLCGPDCCPGVDKEDTPIKAKEDSSVNGKEVSSLNGKDDMSDKGSRSSRRKSSKCASTCHGKSKK